MKIIGKELGDALAEMLEQIERRLKTEAERDLRVVPFEGGSFSDIRWDPGEVIVSLHNGVPTHALNHVFGVALQHIRQRLDFYPGVQASTHEVQAGPMIRTTLRELVMSPEAEEALIPLGLETEWEVEQRHDGLKQLIHGAPADQWNEAGSVGHAFASLQYARFALEHPPELWESLRELFTEQLPTAAATGEEIAALVRKHGWQTPGACLESLVAVRNALRLASIAKIEDRRSGKLL